jgi:O-succinylbenzoate synthase
VKIWPGFDVEVVAALRERYPDVLLQVDANSAYDLTTWPALTRLDPFDLLLIEQPLFDDDLVFHAEIAREIRTPICLDESIHSLRDARAAVHLWRRHDLLARLIVNIKPPRVSGFAEAIAIARYCREEGVRTWIGGMLDSAWGKAFNLNLNGLDAIDLPGDHFSPTGAYFVEDVVATPPTASNGAYSLTDGVATGLDLDWGRVERLGVKVFEQTFEG